MDINGQKADNLTAEKMPKYNAVTLKFNCPPRLYNRLTSFMKSKGFKESTAILISIDEYLTKSNF